MNILRFVMLMALIVWIGAIVFFGAVVAPTVFTVLPTHELAGRVVSRSLGALHWMGIISGIVYLVCSMIYARLAKGFVHPFAARNVLIVAMIALTAISLFVITAKMEVLRADMGVIDNVPFNDARRVEFDRLHEWSTELEGAVLVMGLGVVFLTGKVFSS
jgi:hypothetical protein